MSNNVYYYNNGKRPWVINASKICSNKDLYENTSNDISGLILEASYGNIDVITNDGITKFNNDVSFNSNTYINKIYLSNNSNNIEGNIDLSGNLNLTGNLSLTGFLSDTSYVTRINANITDLSTDSLKINGTNNNYIKIEEDENNIIKKKFF